MANKFLFSRSPGANTLQWTLLSMALLDELIAGFSVVGLPLLRDQLHLSYDQVGLLFSVGAIAGMLVDPAINLLSDRTSKRYWILGGLLILAVGYALAASTHNFIVLMVLFAFIYPANGAAVELSEATLIDAAPQDATRTMTRWTAMSSIGDLLSPLTVAAIVALPLGLSAWTVLCWLGATLWLSAALILWPQRFPRIGHVSEDTDSTPPTSTLASLREALHNPLLLRWSILTLIPTMMDEIFLGFAALYLHDVLHASQAVISLVIAIHLSGGLLSLLALDRLLKHIAPQRLLLWLVLVALVGMIGFLSTHSIWIAALSLFVISLGTAGCYPIAKAAAYAQLPGSSGTVRVVVGLGTPFEILLPGIVGFIAGQFGVLAGVGFLGLAPVLMLIVMPWRTRR